MRTIFSIVIYIAAMMMAANIFVQAQSREGQERNPFDRSKNFDCVCVTAENCPCFNPDKASQKILLLGKIQKSNKKLPKGTKFEIVSKTKSGTKTRVTFPDGQVFTVNVQQPAVNQSESSIVEDVLDWLWDKIKGDSGGNSGGNSGGSGGGQQPKREITIETPDGTKIKISY